MTNIKVGIFTEVYHPTINGVVVSIDTFTKELANLGVESTVFAPSGRGAREEQGVVRIHSIPVHPDYPLPMPWFSKTFRRISRFGLNLIHTQHPAVMGWTGLRAARRLGIPVVTTYHTLIVEYVKTHAKLLPFGPDLMRWLSREYCNRVDLVITPSPSMRRELQKYGVTTRIEVNQTGIYLEDFRHPLDDIRGEFGIPQNHRILLFVGRLSDEKNVKMLLTALSIISYERRDVHLLLVGDGPQRKEYERLARYLGVDRQVTFAGFVPKEKTSTLFGAVDAFVFPSTTDTQGIVIMEAMAAGIPIIAVDALGPGDIIEHEKTGLLTEDDPAEFAQAIVRVLQNKKLASALAANAKNEAVKYSAQETAKRQLALYESVLEHHR